jgi:hypothetical protein
VVSGGTCPPDAVTGVVADRARCSGSRPAARNARPTLGTADATCYPQFRRVLVGVPVRCLQGACRAPAGCLQDGCAESERPDCRCLRLCVVG